MAEGQKDLDKVIDQLSEELKQDQEVRSGTSYFAGVDQDVFRDREQEYRDLEKHFVRWKWLEEAKSIRKENGRELRYLTLPAYYRLDVSLFDKHGLLLATEQANDRVLEVAAFEAEPTKFGRMASHSPRLRLFGATTVESALIDKSNSYYKELARLFPFDLINLDLTTSLTPDHEGPYSRTMQAVDEIFRRQGTHVGTWGLFLTFRNVLDEWEITARTKFLENLQSNLDRFPHVQDAFTKRYHQPSVGALVSKDSQNALSQAVSKWITDRAHSYSLKVDAIGSFHYLRTPPGIPPYDITKLLFRFSKGTLSTAKIPMKDLPRQGWMDDQLVSCIEKHKYVNVKTEISRIAEKKASILRQEIDDLCNVVNPKS